MIVVWVTWTNWKTSTCNIIAKWLIKEWKKIFMFTTINVIIWDKEYQNDTKMTSPDVFDLQRLLRIAKKKWCTIAIIETASHWIKMHRVWWIQYDILALTNITQDHLDLHWTMEDYVNTKLSIFKKLITYDRKKWVKKIAIVNNESNYKELFKNETYDILYTYSTSIASSFTAIDIKYSIDKTTFTIKLPWGDIKIESSLKWEFNVQNILAAVWVFMALWVDKENIEKTVKEIKTIAWRLEEIKNTEWISIFVDYAHTADALEKALITLNEIKWKWKITTVFWATWDRDKTKRPIMWEVVSRLSDKIVLTQDDDYTENTQEIIKDVLPWIERKQWDNFWVISDRESAIRSALIWAEKWDIVFIAWKWDEHTMITNDWPIKWHDKDVVNEILKW